jgi:hypothetical protein
MQTWRLLLPHEFTHPSAARIEDRQHDGKEY